MIALLLFIALVSASALVIVLAVCGAAAAGDRAMENALSREGAKEAKGS